MANGMPAAMPNGNGQHITLGNALKTIFPGPEVFRLVTNLGAFGLVCFMFYQSTNYNQSQATERSALFREELTELRQMFREDQATARTVFAIELKTERAHQVMQLEKLSRVLEDEAKSRTQLTEKIEKLITAIEKKP
jgi:hypothetical protein